MTQIPQTRNSLLLRLRNHSDGEAWADFVVAYEPLVYQMMTACGLQPADAIDQTQEVMTAVARSISRWEPDEHRGRFRTWLYRISRNILGTFWNRARREPNSGMGSGLVELLEAENPMPDANRESTDFDIEFQRRVFALVASRVKARSMAKHWEAFWKSTVQNLPVSEVSTELGIPIGNLYVIKSRILKQMREEAHLFLKQEHEF